MLRHNHTERQEERQTACQAAAAEEAAVSSMQVYGDTSLDAPNGSQIHCINLTLHLPLTLDMPLDARCVYTLNSQVFLSRLVNSFVLTGFIYINVVFSKKPDNI